MPRAIDLFVDTSGWAFHLVGSKDPLHDKVEALMKEAITRRRKLITTNYIISELVALLTSTHFQLPRPKVIEAINQIKSDVSVEILHVGQVIDKRAWALLEARPDKTWSLVDASSIVIMKEFGITEAISTDRCFPQAGLNKLLDVHSAS